MRAPLSWLREYCSPEVDTAQIADRLTMTGTKVETIHRHGVGGLDHFVIARVLSAEKHPQADRLSVCTVDAGDPTPRQIVCGAPNVAAGQTVAVAKPGAVMPDGTRLGKVRLRGVESEGMILAEDELAIGTEHAGILELEADGAVPGTPLSEILEIATDVLELEITANRPDCLGVYGVARELHAATGAPLAAPPWAEDPATEGAVESVSVEVQAPELCPRFTARVFEDVRIGPSPPWLKARLMAAGQRPISNVVDITNYVMLATGQPLHAFDLNRVAGDRLVVRRARPGEQVQTLDGQTRTLDEDMLVIDDAEGPTSIAGVMGGARSEVEDDTTRVLMEVATWNGPNIHRTSLKLGLRSEASARFEKGLQPEQALDAQAMATKLMVELCGARLRPGTIDIGGPGPEPARIHLRLKRVTALLGMEISAERQRQILDALEFETAEVETGLEVRPPAFRRSDITREADVIEEVARLGGLEDLPSTLPPTHHAVDAALKRGVEQPGAGLTPRQKLRRAAADALVAQGLHEVIGWSFTSPHVAERLRLSGQPMVELENPLSSEQSVMRVELLSSLLDFASNNRSRGAGALRLFEAGAVYLPDAGSRLPLEPNHIAVLLSGAVRIPTWREPSPREADFFAAKGVLAGLLESLRATWTVEATEEPFLHPGRAARILIDGTPSGWLGEVHPTVAGEWDLEDPVAGFELDLDRVPEPAPPVYEDVLSFPEVREDLAVVVPNRVTAASVVELIRRVGAPLLQSAEVFDVYRDAERIGEGNVSLALRLSYRAGDRTLTDEEVAAKRAEITASLTAELGGRVRAA